MKHTKPHLDPYQFAYKHNRNAEDATHSLAQRIYSSWKKKQQVILSVFSSSNFSSAFSTMQPHRMASELSKLEVNPRLILWLSTFLSTVLRQFVTKLHCRLPALFPPALHKALSYLLFLLHQIQMTACTGTGTTPNIKYSADSAMEDLSNSDCVYVTERVSNWCRDNSLDLNVNKTKEMLQLSFQISLFMAWTLKEWLSTNI